MKNKRYLCAFLGLFLCSCNIGFGKIQINYQKSEQYQVASEVAFDNSMLNKIEINWISGNVSIVSLESPSLQIIENSQYDLKETEKMHYLVDMNKIIIYPTAEGTFSSKILNKSLTISIPSNWTMQEVSIDVVSSNVEFNNTSNIDRIDVNNVSGRISLDNGKINNLEIDCVSGNVSIENTSINTCNLNVVSSECVFRTSTISSIQNETVSGDIELNGVNFDSCDFDTISGNIKLYLIEDIGYSIYFSSVSGKVSDKLKCHYEGDKYILGNAQKIINIDTVSGDLLIDSEK